MFRILKEQLKQSIGKDVLLLIGPRQVGKTTLLKSLFPKALYINLDLGNYVDILNSRNLDLIKKRLLNTSVSDLIILDEFQRLKDPGLIAKIIHDELPQIHLIITGSSALELTFKASESLAGRKRTFCLYPLALSEKLVQSKKLSKQNLKKHINFNLFESSLFEGNILESLRYGMLPELLNRPQNKEIYLLEYIDSVLLKDIYYLNLIKNTDKIMALLKLLSYQIGQLTSILELSSRLHISRKTVENYLYILERNFIIFSLSPFTKKRRDEIGKTKKFYFYDLGIRNAIINDFSPVEYRNDFGNIFENFVISELIKLNDYYNLRYQMYYWRTKQGSEVDLILEKDNKLKAIEIKTYQKNFSKAFLNTYRQAQTFVVTLNNVESLLLGNLLKRNNSN